MILRGKFANAIKGKISEDYIITVLEQLRRLEFQFRKVSAKSKVKALGKKRTIEIKALVNFTSNDLPPEDSFQEGVPTLFVPGSVNYPMFDFVIWDSLRQCLMCFQITVLNQFYVHASMTNSTKWQKFCWINDEKQNPMEFYWVVPKSCIGNVSKPPSVANDLIVFFEDLISDFPELGKLVLE